MTIHVFTLLIKSWNSNLGTRGPKTTSSTIRFFYGTNFFNWWSLTSFEDKLRDAVTLLYFKVLVSVVEKNNLNFSSVVWVNNTCTNLDAVLHSKTRAWRHTTIDTRWQNNGYTCPDQCAMCRRDHNFISAVKIVSNSTTRTTSWKNSILGKFLNTKAHFYFRLVCNLYKGLLSLFINDTQHCYIFKLSIEGYQLLFG